MVGTRGGGTGRGAPQQGNANNDAENLAPMNLNPQQIAAIFAAMQHAQQQPLAPVNEQGVGDNNENPDGGFSLSPYGRVLQPDGSRRDSELYTQGIKTFETLVGYVGDMSATCRATPTLSPFLERHAKTGDM